MYGLIISDNHFGEIAFGDDLPNFDGLDLISILVGKPLTSEHEKIGRREFGKLYQSIVNHYSSGRILLFSGSAQSEAHNYPGILENVPVVSKRPDRKGAICEYDVIAQMRDMGYEFPVSAKSIRRYKRKNGLEAGLGAADVEEMERAFLREKGLTAEQAAEILAMK